MHVVRDGVRELHFDGVKLSESTSLSRGRTRWVEFELYRASNGQYVLSRVGRSIHYHDGSCPVVARNRIEPVRYAELEPNSVPCLECQPVITDATDDVYPEQPRYWAQVSDTASGVVSSLYKYDADGTKYMTNVARRLLADAALKDADIKETFFVERIS